MGLSINADVWLLLAGIGLGAVVAYVVFDAIYARRLARSQFALRASQRRMDLTSEAAGVGAWEWYYQRDEVWVTDQTRILYGFGPKERINLNRFLAALHPDDREAVRAAVMLSLSNGARFQREYRIVQPDGRVSWVVTRGRVEAGAEGKTAVMRGISLDVSERRLAGERFREVVEAAPTGMLIVGGDGRINLVNAQVEADFGYAREELIGELVEILIPERFQQQHFAHRGHFSAAMYARTMGANREIFGRCKDGREIPLEIDLNPIHSAQGVEVLVSMVDISERKRREHELRQERAFLRQVIDMSPNLIFTKDRQGRFTLVNQTLADIYGTTVEELIGKTDADFNSNSDEVQWFHQKDMEVLDTLQPQLTPEERVTDASGKVRWLETLKLPVMNADGTASQLLGTAIDITERKQGDLELAQQRNELAHLSRVMMLGELSGSLAHELNQPLMAILSNAQAALRFLAQEEPDLDEIREILRDIVSDDKRAGGVIQGLRLLLKKGEMRREAIDLQQLVDDVLGLLRSDLLNSGIEVTVQLASALPLVDGDRVQLQQVLLNLIVNGCDAMAELAVADRCLLVSAELDAGDCVRFCISDRGHGIAPNALQKVFESFFTTKPHGLGLGLAVCRKIIEAHGGRMWAANNEGDGASFYFTVPMSELTVPVHSLQVSTPRAGEA